MKVLLFIVCILIASADGIIAIYSALRRTTWEKRSSKTAKKSLE